MADDMKWLGDFLDISIPMWREDPVIFFREVLRFEPDKWQAVERLHPVGQLNACAVSA